MVIYDDRVEAISMSHRSADTAHVSSLVAEFSDPISWETAISRFIGETQTTLGRAQTTVTLALASTQVRTIDGLPQSSDAKMVRQIVASSPFRYAPRRFNNPIVSDVMLRKAGEVIVAFADLDVVLRIVRVCHASGVDPREVSVATDVASIRGLNSNGSTVRDIERVLSDSLTLPSQEWRSAIATQSLAWRPHALTIVAGLLLIVAAALAPEWRLLTARQNFRRTLSHSSEIALARRRKLQLDSLRGPLLRTRAMAARSIHPLIVLDQFGDALGRDGRVLSFEADSTVVQATVVAPSLAPFLRRLERNSKITNVSVLGGIAHDSLDVGLMERALVRFRYADDASTMLDAGRSQ